MTGRSSPEISSPIAKPSTPQIPPPMLDEGEENTVNVELDDEEDPHAASDVSSGMCCIEFKLHPPCPTINVDLALVHICSGGIAGRMCDGDH